MSVDSPLIRASKKIILNCCLENGAIVAANSTAETYPKEAKNYLYVWPRDASYSCIALDILGVTGVQEKFFDWLMERAEGWSESGLFYEKYYPNGLQALSRLQIDQSGVLLYAVSHHYRDSQTIPGKYKKLVIKTADAICNKWSQDHFTVITNDLWEERLAFPDLEENFTYSISACYAGLMGIHKFFPDKKYLEKATEMKNAIINNHETYLFRSFGKLNDPQIDASLLGVIWPFEVIKPTEALAKNTIREIESKLVKDYGVYRYEHDEYDGWMFGAMHRNKGAGFWPLLNFWMAIVLTKMDRVSEAKRYFEKALPSSSYEIPEQVFDNDIQKAVSPLCWSHSMFVIAAHELGIYE